MAFWRALEVGRVQRGAIGVHALGVGHVRNQPHAGAGNAVGGGETLPGGGGVGRAAPGCKFVHHLVDSDLGQRIVTDYAITGSPMRERGVCLPMGCCQFRDPLAFGRGQLVGGAAVEMQVHESSRESVEDDISVDAAAASAAPSGIAFDGWAMVSVLTMRARPAACSCA